MLKVEQLDTSYGASQILFGIDLQVDDGECVTLMGRNGMGKTTILHSIMGIVIPQAGHITLDGRSIYGVPPYKIARAGLGLVPERRQVFPHLTVFENLIATAANRFNRPNPWTIEKVMDIFPELAARYDSMGNLLSGGEQQMLAIGRALMTNPRLLILDDATEGLAPLVRQKIWASLIRLKQEGQSVLVVDKNVDDLARIADRHYILEKGKMVWQGTTKELRADENILHCHLGVEK